MNIYTRVEEQSGLNYYIVYPKDYNPNQTYPTIIHLHGAGERGDQVKDMPVIKNHWPLAHTDYDTFPFILIAPQCPKASYWPVEVYNLKTFIDNMLIMQPVDKDRIYLTGLSMGGYGTWYMSYRYPDLFAAIAPVCGSGIRSSHDVLTSLPIWAFHGTKDPVVPYQDSQYLADTINAKGGNVKLTLYEDVGHNSWEHAYKDKTLYEWFLTHKKTT